MSSHYSTAIDRLRRSPYQSVTSFLVVTLTLFMATVFFLDAAAAHRILSFFESRPQVIAYFQEDYQPTDAEVSTLTSKYQVTGLVEEVVYVSKEDALTIYRDLNRADPLLLEAVTANMLPASIEISAKNPDDLKGLADQLKSEPGIEDVRFEEEIVSSLVTWTRSVRTTRFALAALQVFITFIVILSVIGYRVMRRKEEINILQLIGATTSYVQAPFIIEGMLYGVIGSIIAWGGAYLVLLYSTPFFVSVFSQIPELYPSTVFMLQLLGAQVGLGALIGGLGGLMAVRRFLKA